MHSTEALDRPILNTWRKRMRPYGRTSTHMSFRSEICPVFRVNDLLALMLNLNAVGVGAKPILGLCLIVKRRERRFPEAEEV